MSVFITPMDLLATLIVKLIPPVVRIHLSNGYLLNDNIDVTTSIIDY